MAQSCPTLCDPMDCVASQFFPFLVSISALLLRAETLGGPWAFFAGSGLASTHTVASLPVFTIALRDCSKWN